jgi:hypothetical protein
VRDSGNLARGEVTPSDIRGALKRIQSSRTMGASKKLLQLLNFVVETALKGEAHQLKETTIAVSVFGRAPDYDPKADTVVRNQALRLRLKLKDYYESEGAKDPLVICIPKGQYAPLFVARTCATGQPGVASHRRSHV